MDLVGGIPIPLKNMSSSIGMTISNLWKNKMKPTNPNAHTHVDDTDVQTHFAKQMFRFQYTVSKKNCIE